MNKGFTLIELLAVIIILGVLTLITVVSINPILNDSEKKLTDIQIENIEESASLYYVKHGMGLADFEIENPRYCINVSELIEKGYINNDEVTNPKTGEKVLGSVKVTYKTNNYIYEYQDNACTNYDRGIICERVESTNVGNVPEGNFNAGDAYYCKVDPDKEPYKFYVLTTSDDNSDMVNLIMDQNINSDGTPAGTNGVTQTENSSQYNLVAWLNQEDYELANGKKWSTKSDNNTFGPLTAMKFLEEATKNWINANEMIINIPIYETGPSEKEFKTYNARARLPIYLKDVEKTEVSTKTNVNAYLYDNFKQNVSAPPYGYWTLSGHSNAFYVRCVKKNGIIDAHSVSLADSFGVRPVISMYKFQME